MWYVGPKTTPYKQEILGWKIHLPTFNCLCANVYCSCTGISRRGFLLSASISYRFESNNKALALFFSVFFFARVKAQLYSFLEKSIIYELIYDPAN